MPVLAAGGIVIRNGARPLIAVVQRRRDGAWVLPKGKLKPNERPRAAAKREATEETGCEVRVHEFLGVISYLGGNGPKVAHFWRMQATDSAGRAPTDDIKAVEWLPLAAAVDRLSLPHEQFFLGNVGRRALRTMLKQARRPRPSLSMVSPQPAAAPPLPDAASPRAVEAPPQPSSPSPQPSSLQPPLRWPALVQLKRRWQAALGRTG
jgi:8-oxo-dGTP diphosphatase